MLLRRLRAMAGRKKSGRPGGCVNLDSFESGQPKRVSSVKSSGERVGGVILVFTGR